MRYAESLCKRTEDNFNYIFTGPCHNCKKEVAVKVPKSALFHFRQGKLIQQAMPSVSPADREFLISGICGDCWQKVTKEPEEPEVPKPKKKKHEEFKVHEEPKMEDEPKLD